MRKHRQVARRSSFLKKRSKRFLQIQRVVPPDGGATASEKSLLVLFFRKERLACNGCHQKTVWQGSGGPLGSNRTETGGAESPEAERLRAWPPAGHSGPGRHRSARLERANTSLKEFSGTRVASFTPARAKWNAANLLESAATQA
jgi:hypothetical protein